VFFLRDEIPHQKPFVNDSGFEVITSKFVIPSAAEGSHLVVLRRR
jgi:hypothetical protein